MRAGARAFHSALDAVPEDAPAAERVRAALAWASPRRRGAARRRDRVHARVALPRGRVPRRDRRRAPPVRGALARALSRGRRDRRPADRPRRRRRRVCSSSRPRTGRTRGSTPAATRTRSQIGSSRSSSTGCAATRRRREADPHRQPVRLRRRRAPARRGPRGPSVRRQRPMLTTAAGEATEIVRSAGDGRRDLRLRRRRHVQRGAERHRAGRAARVPSRGRHECPSARARPPSQPRRRPPSGVRGADAPHRPRARERSPLRVQRRARVRCRARPRGRRARPQARRAEARRRGVPEGRVGTLWATHGRFDERLEIEGAGRAAFVLVANCLAVHLCGTDRARPRSRRLLRRRARLRRSGDAARPRPPAAAPPRRARVRAQGRQGARRARRRPDRRSLRRAAPAAGRRRGHGRRRRGRVRGRARRGHRLRL